MKQKRRNSYKADLLADLKDSEYAAGYLSASMAESVETFLLALRDVTDAQKGIARVASEARVNRENLYRMLSEDGNPRLSSLHAVLDALGLRIVVQNVSMKAPTIGASPLDAAIEISAAITNAEITVEHADYQQFVYPRRHKRQNPELYIRGTQPIPAYPTASTAASM